MELFVDLGLKEIASIVGKMGLTTELDEMHVDGLELNGVKYSYDKNGNEMTITDSLGNITKVRINYEEEHTKDAFNRDITYLKHEVGIDYVLPSGEIIRLENSIPLDKGYEAFENVHRHDLLKDLRTKYLDKEGKEIASFSLDLDEICLKENNVKYIFDKDGIKYNNVVLSVDGDTLVSLSGNPIPSKDLVLSYNLGEEKEKINRIIKENKDLHPFTIEELEDTSRKMERRDRFVKRIIEFYDEDTKHVRDAIKVRQNLIDNLSKNVLDKDGLDLVSSNFYYKTRENVRTFRR